MKIIIIENYLSIFKGKNYVIIVVHYIDFNAKSKSRETINTYVLLGHLFLIPSSIKK